jgi:Tfp pilus assembly protein PilF
LNPSENDAESPLSPAVEAAIQEHVAARMRFWAAVAGVPLLVVVIATLVLLILARRDREELGNEVASLKAEAVRLGQPIEIHNPKWGTVIDGVDPGRIPGRDPRDPRMGAVLQQYLPRGNDAQLWELRARGGSPRPVVEILPAKAYLSHAFGFHRARDFSNATKAFERCIELYPDFPDGHDGLARSLRDADNLTSALASHDRAIELDAARHDFYWERGVTYLRMNNPDGAISNFLACLERKSDFANACNGLGVAYRSKGNFQEALRFHDKAIALSPAREEFYRERGMTYQSMGDGPRAAADSAKARELKQGPQ